MSDAPIIIRAYTPTPREEEEARLLACRPADRSALAITAALGALQGERATAVYKLGLAKQTADQMLLRGGIPEIQAARTAVEAAEIQVEQFVAMEAGMRVSLARAEREEAAELAALAASIPQAEAILAAWCTFVRRDYAKAAAAIAKGLETEAAAIRAYATLRDAARLLPDRAMPEAMPAVPGGGPLGAVVALPGHRMPPPTAYAYGYSR